MATPAKDYDLGDLDFSEESEDFMIDERDSGIPVARVVPANMVQLAQRSWDTKKTIILSFRGKSNQMITDFVETMKAAGDHTTPLTTTKVVREPEDSIVVEVTSTQRRGRKPGEKAPKDAETGETGESIPDVPPMDTSENSTDTPSNRKSRNESPNKPE